MVKLSLKVLILDIWRTIMTLGELYKMNYEIVDCIAMNQHRWQDGQTFTMSKPRPTNAFLYTSDSHVICNTENGEIIEVPCGSILYIPAGRQYTHTFFAEKSKLFVYVLWE